MQNMQDLLAKRQILKPRSVIITSRYFWRKWRPILGNSLAVLIMEARQKCYRNLQTGEVRNWFYATMKELGQTTGFSSKKIASLLKSPHAQKFIRFKPTYIYNPDLGKRIKGKCLFQVTLDDPLIPNDELQLIGQEIHQDVSNPSQSKGQGKDEDESHKVQPSREKVCNNYSTISELNKDIIYNTTITRSIKGEQVQAIAKDNLAGYQESSVSNLVLEQNIENHNHFYQEISRILSAESILCKTILRLCIISEISNEGDPVVVRINAPSAYFKQVLECRVKEKRQKLLANLMGRNVIIEIV